MPRGLARWARHGLRLVIAAAFIAGGSDVVDAQAEAPRFAEAKVKAAFVFSFARYIEWPPQCFATPDAPFVIGVTSQSRVYAELLDIARARTLVGRRITVREVRSPADAAGVHLLFVDQADEKALLSMLAELPGAGVVTVGESERFSAAGGMLTLYEREDRLRFMVNRDATRMAVAKLSSQLLKLAVPAGKGS